jgi:hypothetical protein
VRKPSSRQAVKYSSCWTPTMLISDSVENVVRTRFVSFFRTRGVRRRWKVIPERKVEASYCQFVNYLILKMNCVLVSLPATMRRDVLLSISLIVILSGVNGELLIISNRTHPFSSLYLRMYDIKSARSVTPSAIL